MSDWGKGVINNIGWGQGANNDIGWGSIYDKSNAGETLLSGFGYNAFTIEVKTDNAGTSNDNQFQFTGAEGDYDVVAKQGGVIVETFSDLSDAATITFSNGVGTYILEVTPKEVNPFNIIEFDNQGDKSKITDTKNWGNIVWNSFYLAFFGCNNMATTAPDIPNLSNVTNMRGMFANTLLANPDTTNWDTSNITDMTSVFNGARVFNNPVNNWNVSNVTNMLGMFRGTDVFNQPVNNWDTSNVTNMRLMFDGARVFNQDCSDWDFSNVTTMDKMFNGSALTPENLDKLYIALANSPSLQNNVPFGAANTKRTSASTTAKNFIINNYAWNITDNGLV